MLLVEAPARVAELADAAVSKTAVLADLGVRVPPWAPCWRRRAGFPGSLECRHEDR